MWPGLLPVSCLLVSLRMIPTFLWVSSSHNQQQQKTQPHREASILIIPMSPPHLDPIRHTHLRGEGWTLGCLACYVITHCAQARQSGEERAMGKVQSIRCPQPPSPSLSPLLMMTPHSALSLSPGRSLFPDLPRTVIKIWWAHNL